MQPAVVLMGIDLPGMSGIEATRLLLDTDPATAVVLMGTCSGDELPAGAEDCGAAAYLRKEDLTPAAPRALAAAGRS